jgi:superfamily I DNA/RNA helicase
MIASRALFFVNEGVTDVDERIRNTRLFNSNAFIAWQDRWWRRVCAETNLGRERRLIYAQNSSDPNGKALTEKEVARLSRSGLERARGLVMDHLQYDLVIADEAQNMFPDNWEGLKLSTKQNSGVVAVSSDPTQSMYGSRPWTDQKMTGFADLPWRKLNGSYRLPDDYLAFVGDFIERFPPDDEVNIPTPPEHPSLSGSTMYRIVSKSGYQKTAIAEAVQFATDILQFLPHQVVILTATNDRGNSIVAELRRRGIVVTHTYDEAKRPTFGLEDGVRASTFHSYAGWESPCVIIDTDLDKKNTNPNGLLYSGVTRLAKREMGSAVIFVEGDNQYRDIIREYCEEIKY